MDLTALDYVLEVGLQEGVELWMRLSALLHEGQLVACAKAILQEERAAKALECTLAHDADTVTEHVSLVHVMSGQDDDPVLLIALEHVPQVAASAEVHACGRLIEQHKLRVAAKSDAN